MRYAFRSDAKDALKNHRAGITLVVCKVGLKAAIKQGLQSTPNSGAGTSHCLTKLFFVESVIDKIKTALGGAFTGNGAGKINIIHLSRFPDQQHHYCLGNEFRRAGDSTSI
jgi:hypothetical protein